MLETRDCPSAPYPYPSSSYNPPVIDSLNAVNTNGHLVEISGEVGAAFPECVSVDFTGVVTAHIQANTDGSFDFVAEATDVGTITAVATDSEVSLSSETATAVITSLGAAPPTIVSFDGEQGLGTCWTFTGEVEGVSPELMIITFSGLQTLQNVTITPNSDGEFTICVQLLDSPADTGLLTVVATDCWGQNSDPVACWVNC